MLSIFQVEERKLSEGERILALVVKYLGILCSNLKSLKFLQKNKANQLKD